MTLHHILVIIAIDIKTKNYVSYFEHHENKGISKPTTYKLNNLVLEDVSRFIVDELYIYIF